MVEYERWIENIGEIFLSNKDCFWRFPRHMFLNKALCIGSPWFSQKNEEWRIVKTPHEDAKDYITLYLWKKINRRPKTHEYTVKLYIKSRANNQKILATCSGDVNQYGFVCYKFFDVNDVENKPYLSCRGLVDLFFDIQIKEDIDPVSSTLPATLSKDDSESEPEPGKTEEPELKGLDRLVDNMKNLLLDEQTSDVVLKVEDREFKVHKCILKIRSPVFFSMFQPHTKESASGNVDIPDCSAPIFELFLLYLYTGNADEIASDNVCELYYISDKYQMNDLKCECIEFMERNLTVGNFCEIMTLCFQHSELRLQKTATRFFCDNVKKIIKTVEWQKFLKDFPTQANELYIKAIDA